MKSEGRIDGEELATCLVIFDNERKHKLAGCTHRSKYYLVLPGMLTSFVLSA